MSGKYYEVLVEWGYGEDTEQLDVEAESFEEACRKAYDEWSPTGWEGLTVYDMDSKRRMSFNLDRPFDEGKAWDAG